MTATAIKLLNHANADGSRCFYEVAEHVLPDVLHRRLKRQVGIDVTSYIFNGIELWISATYRGHKFDLHNDFETYWISVSDATCPNDVLCEFAAICERRPRWWRWWR